ncbi:hypothetical protein D3C81_1979340 [compost metagenome]
MRQELTQHTNPGFPRLLGIALVPEVLNRRWVFVDRPVLAGLISTMADTGEVFPQRELKLIRKILDTTQGILVYLLEAHAIHNTSYKH